MQIEVEHLYIIGFFAAVILLYIIVIGVSVLIMVNDKTYSEEEIKIDNVKKIMQDIIDRNNIIMYVLIGFLGFMALGISYFAYNKNKNMSDAFKALTDNKITLSILLVLIIVMFAINSLCKYIQDIKSLNDLYNIGVGIVSSVSVSVIVVILGIVMYKRFRDKNRKVYLLAPVA